MLQFKQNDTAVALILTLTELATLSAPFYLFVFTHVTTKAQIIFIKSDSEDESDFPQRYNQFTINPTVIFASQPPGEWHYRVYEQDNGTNTDPTAATGLLEDGKMILGRSVDFAYAMYDSPTTFKAYNG